MLVLMTPSLVWIASFPFRFNLEGDVAVSDSKPAQPLGLSGHRVFQYIRGRRGRPQASARLSALTLPRMRSVLTSNVTFCPSASPESPARSTALMCTNTSVPPSLGWMNPKPFWPLNHFTVPVVILFSKAHMRVFARLSREPIQLRRCLWKRSPRGTFNKAQRLNECLWSMPSFGTKQERHDVNPTLGSSS